MPKWEVTACRIENSSNFLATEECFGLVALASGLIIKQSSSITTVSDEIFVVVQFSLLLRV
jgi:hypothetical protein